MAKKSIRLKVIHILARDFPCNGEPTPSVLDSCPILRLRSRSLPHEDDAPLDTCSDDPARLRAGKYDDMT